MSATELRPHQIIALRRLAVDPSALVESATLSLLRKRGLAGRLVERDGNGRQKTTSPVTPEGAALLARSPYTYDLSIDEDTMWNRDGDAATMARNASRKEAARQSGGAERIAIRSRNGDILDVWDKGSRGDT